MHIVGDGFIEQNKMRFVTPLAVPSVSQPKSCYLWCFNINFSLRICLVCWVLWYESNFGILLWLLFLVGSFLCWRWRLSSLLKIPRSIKQLEFFFTSYSTIKLMKGWPSFSWTRSNRLIPISKRKGLPSSSQVFLNELY